MNKILLSGLAGLAVINAAVAVPSPADRRALCEKHPEKYVWVEKTETCVPINPCKSDNSSIVEAYCNKTFANVQLGNWTKGLKLARAYVERNLGTSVIGDGRRIRKNIDISTFGQDYIPCETSDGGYVVFEFDDLSDWTRSDILEGSIKGACKIFGDLGILYHIHEKNTYTCPNVDNENDCTTVAELASDVSDRIIQSEYVNSTNDIGESYWKCVLRPID